MSRARWSVKRRRAVSRARRRRLREIESLRAFPVGSYDDQVDSVVYAWGTTRAREPRATWKTTTPKGEVGEIEIDFGVLDE